MNARSLSPVFDELSRARDERMTTVVLLPGLGADQRLFESVRLKDHELIIPPWPIPDAGDSIAAFAARLRGALPNGEALFLGGSSFGGMVALELAALLQPRGVFLIGSCSSPDAVTRLARPLAALAPILPESVLKPRAWVFRRVARFFGRLSDEQRELFVSMACEAKASFILWGVKAILSWRPSTQAAPVHQIHGSEDRLIPLARVRPDSIVQGGGHLLPLTHPVQVTRFMSDVLCKHSGG